MVEVGLGMNIKQDYIPINPWNRPGRKLTGQRTITVHNTGNYGVGALAHARYIKSAECQNRQASWHFSVDDKDVYQHIPLDEVAYHAGDGAYGPGNSTSIAVEICEVENQAEANRLAAELVAKMIKEEGLGIGDVVQHNHWTGKNCPRLLRATPNGWNNWLQLVKSYLTPSSIYSADTTLNGHELGGGFRARYEALGELAAPTLGLPLGNEETAIVDGTPRVIQRFERGVLAWYPIGTPDGVEPSNPFHVRCLTLEEVKRIDA